MVAWEEVAVSAAVSIVVTLVLTWLAFRVEIERRIGRLETLEEAFPAKDLRERLHSLEVEVERLRPMSQAAELDATKGAKP